MIKRITAGLALLLVCMGVAYASPEICFRNCVEITQNARTFSVSVRDNDGRAIFADTLMRSQVVTAHPVVGVPSTQVISLQSAAATSGTPTTTSQSTPLPGGGYMLVVEIYDSNGNFISETVIIVGADGKVIKQYDIKNKAA